MGGKTKTTQQSNSTQTVAPPSWTLPGITAVSNKVTQAAQQPVPKYTGDFISGVDYNPAMQAYADAAKAAGGYAGQLDSAIAGYKPVTANYNMALPTISQWTGANTDQQMRDAITAETAAVQRNLLTQVLPGLRSSALDAGAYSGDRASAILPQLALDDATRNAGEIASKYVYENAQANQDRSLNAWNMFNNSNLAAFNADTQRGGQDAQLASQQQQFQLSSLPDLLNAAMQLRTSQGDLYANNANLQQKMAQTILDNAMQKHQYDVTSPYEGLDLATALLTQLSGNYGTTTGSSNSTTTQSTSGLGSIVSGLLGAAGMIGSLPMGGGQTMMSQLFKPRAATTGGYGGTPPTYGTTGLLGGM